MTFVGVARIAPSPSRAPNDHGHVSEPFRMFVFEECLSQLGHVVLPVGLQGPDEFSRPPSHEDVVGRPVSDERLGLVELAVRWALASEAEEELAGAGELAIGARQEHGAQAMVP